MLKATLEADLKAALLAGDKRRVDILKMAKTALQYKEVDLGVREVGLTDEQVVEVLAKEAKKRLDAATMYDQAGDTNRAALEREEYDVLGAYLPAQMSDEELAGVVAEIVGAAGEVTQKDMGKIIGVVKARVGSQADGSRIATIVKQHLS